MSDKEFLTIFTPTYNRRKLLEKLYETLKLQKNKRFLWLIIDDGSTDDTEIYIKKIIEENLINIKFLKQKNSGKYIAYNKAIEYVNTEYFCCIDSDDYLVKDSIEQIYNDLMELKTECLGLIYPWNKKIEYKVREYINIQDFKFMYGVNQENTIVFKTKILKENKFPENNSEKFMSEEIIYNKLNKYGKFKFINRPIVVGEYQENGLTKNIYKIWAQNYENTMLLFKSRYDFLKNYKINIKFFNRCKCIINCNIINILNKKSILKNTPSILYSFFLIVPSYIYLLVKRREF